LVGRDCLSSMGAERIVRGARSAVRRIGMCIVLVYKWAG
jgi:hypothetical protein